MAELYYRVHVQAGASGYDLSHDLSSFMVEEDARRPDQLTVELSDPFKVLSHALQEGMEVEVDLGRADDHSLVFRGQIYKVECGFPADGVASLRLTAYDRSVKMGLRKRNRRFAGMPLSQIVTTVAGSVFQRIAVDVKGDPTFAGNGIRQQDETDLAFLLRLAAKYGCEMFVVTGDVGDALHFVSQYRILTAEPETTVTYRRCGAENVLLEFEASSDVGDIRLPRVFSGIDYETGEPTEVTTAEIEEVGTREDPYFDESLAELYRREPDKAAELDLLLAAKVGLQQDLRRELGGEEREATPGFVTAEELRVRAENQWSTSLHGMRGRGVTEGNQHIRAQTSLFLDDVGGRFSGTWYLSQVRHVLDGRGYRTEFECRR